MIDSNALPPGLEAMLAGLGVSCTITRVDAFPPSSTTQHRVDVVLADGSPRCFVLRRYHDLERLAHDPWYAPANETLALELLADSAVPAPRLYAADLSAAHSDVPAILVSWLPGAPEWKPTDVDRYLARTAEVLVAFHAVDVPGDVTLRRYAPYLRDTEWPRLTTRAAIWKRVANVVAGPPPPHRESFIHRDYHPGNILWDGTRVTGVVDWATAAWGPPGIDLARMRLNLAFHLDEAVADRFVRAYGNAGGDVTARHPYWDLLDAADMAADLDGEELARLEGWIEGVLAECGA